ncbi:MAG: hypothetical protein JW836_11455 [Deltaproteobacteria bacterium]|nr:hypothetical protein [Deltaproteobacteria bacterium]
MILGTALAIILQLFSGALRSGDLADQYTRAVTKAREKMEEILLAPVMAEETFAGRWEDGFAWEAEVVMHDPDEDKAPADGMSTFLVTVKVAWDDGRRRRQVAFQTLALAGISEDG